MLRQIILHGKLKEVYGGVIAFHVDSVAEAVRALCYQIKGFREELEEGHYRVYLGEHSPEYNIDESLLGFGLGDIRDIHIQPILEGAGGNGSGKVFAGIALVALSFAIPGAVGALGPSIPGVFGSNIITQSFVAKIGLSLVLGGISQLLTPQVDAPDPASFERPEQKPSFLFNGAVNTTEQGGPVPLVYGTMRVGSIVVSSGLSVERL